MGHTRIGRLPATRKWKQVIELISGGADISDVASATAKAAERALQRAADDPLFQQAFWLLTQIPLAAREERLGPALRRLGLSVGAEPTLVEICTAMMASLDAMVDREGRKGDFGELAVLSAVESLNSVVSRDSADLLGPDHAAAATRDSLKRCSTAKQFGVLARDYYARLTRRSLDYYLSREIPSHVGINGRFQSMGEHRAFEEALDAHCAEASRIMQDFSAQWFSKTNYEGGIDKKKAGAFAHIAFNKICSELMRRREAHA